MSLKIVRLGRGMLFGRMWTAARGRSVGILCEKLL